MKRRNVGEVFSWKRTVSIGKPLSMLLFGPAARYSLAAAD
jgi:hypothetical protein